MQAGLAATMLAALTLSLILFYAMASAITTRNAYQAMSLRREIDDLNAQNALLRYQANLIKSSHRIQQAASRMNLRPADPAREIDYVIIPGSDHEANSQLAASGPAEAPSSLVAALAELATEVVGSARGRAEASTE